MKDIQTLWVIISQIPGLWFLFFLQIPAVITFEETAASHKIIEKKTNKERKK